MGVSLQITGDIHFVLDWILQLLFEISWFKQSRDLKKIIYSISFFDKILDDDCFFALTDAVFWIAKVLFF